MVGRQPGDGRRVAFFCEQLAAAPADGSVGIMVDLAARDVRHLRIEQCGEGAEDAAFRLSAQAEQDEIMARENGIDDLRYDSVVVANDAGKYGATFAQPGHKVFAELVFNAARAETRFSEGTSTQFAESPGKTHGGNPQNEALCGLYRRRAMPACWPLLGVSPNLRNRSPPRAPFDCAQGRPRLTKERPEP